MGDQMKRRFPPGFHGIPRRNAVYRPEPRSIHTKPVEALGSYSAISDLVSIPIVPSIQVLHELDKVLSRSGALTSEQVDALAALMGDTLCRESGGKYYWLVSEGADPLFASELNFSWEILRFFREAAAAGTVSLMEVFSQAMTWVNEG